MASNLPAIGYIFGPPRSGTSLFQRLLCNAPGTLGIYEPLREEMKQQGNLKKSVFQSYDDGDLHPFMKDNKGKFFVLKEALGKNLLSQIDNLFKHESADVQRSRPIFIFRNPVDTYKSVKVRKWYSLKEFIDIFSENVKFAKYLKDKYKDKVLILSYEKLIDNPKNLLKKSFLHWGLPIENISDSWSDNYHEKIYMEDRLKNILDNKKFHTSIVESGKVGIHAKSEMPLEHEELSQLEKEATPLYNQILSLS